MSLPISKSLIYYSVTPLVNTPDTFVDQIPGLKNFLKFRKFCSSDIGVIDRTGIIKMPFKVATKYALPVFDKNFKKDYRDCVMEAVKNLDAIHQRTGKKFRLLYSGGVDSTCIFAAFVEYYGVDRASKILEIACSKDSIDENPWVWERYIAKYNFKILSSHEHSEFWKQDVIVLMGEGNDQIFGGLGNGYWSSFCNNENLYRPVSKDLLCEYLSYKNNIQDKDSLNYIAEKLLGVAAVSPIPITNMYMFIWWYAFALTWDGIMDRVLAQANVERLPAHIFESGLIQFYNTADFQRWSMTFHYENPDRFAENKHYKFICKQFCLSVLDIPEYIDKLKYRSMPVVQRLSQPAYMIDSDMCLLNDLKYYLDFVNTENSFT